MKERPILFSGPMVRAILEGRKTQTRRVVRPQPTHIEWFQHQQGWLGSFGVDAGTKNNPHRMVPCPYGVPGDRLWVRESFLCFGSSDSITPAVQRACQIRYKADDGPAVWIPMPAEAKEPTPSLKGKPSIHMPRWTSRITLEIVSVWVERLQDITEADAIAEGIERDAENPGRFVDYRHDESAMPARASYWSLWDKINGDGSAALNPWVWVVEFKRVDYGSDGFPAELPICMSGTKISDGADGDDWKDDGREGAGL